MRDYQILFIVLLVISCCSSNNQSEENSVLRQPVSKSDSVRVEVKLPIYSVNSCLFHALDSTLAHDAQCPYYRDTYSCYDFAILDRKDFYQIEVRPNYIDSLDYGTYFGAFYHKKRLFLCSGDFPPELFIHTQKDSVCVNINRKNLLTKEDSVNYHFKKFLFWGIDVPRFKVVIQCLPKPVYYFSNTCYND